jgi:hypothetical protein
MQEQFGEWCVTPRCHRRRLRAIFLRPTAAFLPAPRVETLRWRFSVGGGGGFDRRRGAGVGGATVGGVDRDGGGAASAAFV